MSASTPADRNHMTPSNGAAFSSTASSAASAGTAGFGVFGSPAAAAAMFGSPMGMYFPYPHQQQMMMMAGGAPRSASGSVGGAALPKRITISLGWTETTSQSSVTGSGNAGADTQSTIKLRGLVRDQDLSVQDFLLDLFASPYIQDEYLEPLLLLADSENRNVIRGESPKKKKRRQSAQDKTSDDNTVVQLSLGPDSHISFLNGKRMKATKSTDDSERTDASNPTSTSATNKRKRSPSIAALSNKGRSLRLVMMSIAPNGERVQLDPRESLYWLLDDGPDLNVVITQLGQGSWGGGLGSDSSRGGTVAGGNKAHSSNEKAKIQQKQTPEQAATPFVLSSPTSSSSNQNTKKNNDQRLKGKSTSTVRGAAISASVNTDLAASASAPSLALAPTTMNKSLKQKKKKTSTIVHDQDQNHAKKAKDTNDDVEDDELIGHISKQSEHTSKEKPADSQKTSKPKEEEKAIKKEIKNKNEEDTKLSKTTSKKKDVNAPKRKLTAFMIFSNENRAQIKKENPEATSNQLTSLLSKAYKALSSEERAELDRKAADDKQRYETEMVEHLQEQQGEEESPGSTSSRDTTESPLAPALSKDSDLMCGDKTIELMSSSVPADFDFTDRDVLVAGNGQAKKHIGNINYKEYYASKRDDFQGLSDKEKNEIVNGIMKRFTFWRQGKGDDNYWHRMHNPHDVKQKVRSDLRPRPSQKSQKEKDETSDSHGDSNASRKQNEVGRLYHCFCCVTLATV